MNENTPNNNTPDQAQHHCPACNAYVAHIVLGKAKTDGLPLPTSVVTTDNSIQFFIPATAMSLWAEWLEETPDRAGYLHTDLWDAPIMLTPTPADLLAQMGRA